ncbi:MAG: DUF429 domain-containing protein, partial [Desulfobacteraceae bacterium]
MKYIGIDGCSGGWFYVALDKNLFWSCNLLTTIAEIKRVAANQTIIMIDIPIGLKEKGSRERLCDLEARKLLKKRSASIFPAPSRPALDGDNYHHASQINYTSTGRKLSRQTWHLIHKIKEVDLFLTETKNCPVFHEFHPELGFLALNRFVPLSYSKKRAEGQRERLKILEEYLDKTPEIFNTALQRFLRKDVAADD